MPEHPLNAATRHLLDKIRQANFPPIYTMPVEQARAGYQMSVGALAEPPVPVARVEDFSIPGGAGQPMRARLWADSKSAGLPVLLYVHGGGFVVGAIETCESMCRQVAKQSGAAVVAIDYRLAPEHKFPAGLDDAFAAVRWLVAEGSGLGLDGTRIAVGGDSAGATITASTAILARDAGIRLALQLMFYPSVQTGTLTDSFARYSRELLLSRELMAWFDEQYKDPSKPEDWKRQPLKAPSLAGLAPAWIGLAECDALADDGRLYADALRAAGVPVELREWPGVIHDFINMGRFLPEAAQAHTAVALALRQAFAGG
ncbi:MAG: alpha/beta hydrolase [Aquabacterium sp.]|nr:MAG: alpha/beta hydrolase [Aquabacterium sp.]